MDHSRAVDADTHPCPQRSACWSSRIMSSLEASVSTTPSSVGAASAGSAGSGAPASGNSAGASNPVVASDPVLQPPASDPEATVKTGSGKHVTVTLVSPAAGKKKLTAWCWRFVSIFTPTINDKNVICLLKRVDGTPCNHTMKWTPSAGNKKGSGTTGLNKHLTNFHKAAVEAAVEEAGTEEDKQGPIRAAIGERGNPFK